jgi:hypothetical protein
MVWTRRDTDTPSSRKPIAGELPRTNHFGVRLADEAAVRAARNRFRAADDVETERQDDGRFVRGSSGRPRWLPRRGLRSLLRAREQVQLSNASAGVGTPSRWAGPVDDRRLTERIPGTLISSKAASRSVIS